MGRGGGGDGSHAGLRGGLSNQSVPGEYTECIQIDPGYGLGIGLVQSPLGGRAARLAPACGVPVPWQCVEEEHSSRHSLLRIQVLKCTALVFKRNLVLFYISYLIFVFM